MDILLLLLLFPLVAALVAFSRNVLGLTGFGMFVPILMAYAFVYSGVPMGILLFAIIMVLAGAGRLLARKLRLSYQPRMAVLLWLIAMGVYGLMRVLPGVGVAMGIFPVILFMMLTEANIEAQITRTWQEALVMTLETLGVAIVGSLMIGSAWVRDLFITYPIQASVGVLVADYLIGKYKGLRLMEIWRFRKLVRI